MLPGDQAGEVARFEDRITLGGQVVDAIDWDGDRPMSNIPGDSAGNGLTQGSLTPVTDPDILDEAVSPWTRLGVWPPANGTPVTIETRPAGSTTWIPVLTGITDATTTEVPGDLTVKLIEKVDRFTRTTAWPPLIPNMVPYAENGARRRIELHMNAYIDQAFSDAGFQLVPAPLPNTVLYARLQGTMWPRVGDCLTAVADVDFKPPIGIESGIGMWNCGASWKAATPVTSFDFCAYVPTLQSDSSGTVTGASYLKYELTGAGAYVLVHTLNRSVELVVGGVSRASLPNGSIGNRLVVRRIGGTWTLTSGAASTTYAQGASPTVTGVVFTASGNSRGSMICLAAASTSTPAPDATTFTPTAVVDFAAHMTSTTAAPTVETQPCATFLDTLSKALWSHWGFNENGQAWWWPTIARLGLSPVVQTPPPISRTLSDDTDIIGSLSFTQDIQNTASQVTCTLKVPNVLALQQPRIELWRDDGSRAITAADGVTPTILDVPDDTEWLGIDLGHVVATPGTNAGQRAAAGLGNQFIGDVDLPDTGSGPDDRPARTDEWAANIGKITDRTYKVEYQAVGTSAVTPKTGKGTGWNWLPLSRQDNAGTIVRGMGRVVYVDGSVASGDTGSDAPVMTWDAGAWAGSHADYMVAWLVALMTNDRVTMEDIEIVPDPRLQLGDRVTLDLTLLGVQVPAVITRKKLTRSKEGLSMTVTLLITGGAVRNKTTWVRFQQAWAGHTWAQLQAAWAGQAWTDLQANPLRFTDDEVN